MDLRLRPSFALVTQGIVCCPAKADIQVRFPASAIDGLGLFFLEAISRRELRRLINNFAVSWPRASLPWRRQMSLNRPGIRRFTRYLGEKWTYKWTAIGKVHTQVHSQNAIRFCLDYREDVSLTGCELRCRGRERLPAHHEVSEERAGFVAGAKEKAAHPAAVIASLGDAEIQLKRDVPGDAATLAERGVRERC